MRTSITETQRADHADMRQTIPYVDDFIHLNSAAGSLADRCVIQAVTAHLELEARCGNTEARLMVAEQINNLYSSLARLTCTAASRLSLAESHTAAWQTAFRAVPLQDGDRILVGETEWGGNCSAIWRRAAATGAKMGIIPSYSTGAIDTRALSKMLDNRVKLVCLTLVPAINGLINPVEPIVEQLRGHPAWLFVDAAQAFANVVQHLSEPRFDVVTVSARKYLRAPRGTGFAVYSQRFMDEITPVELDQFSGPWRGEAPVPITSARKFEFVETSLAVRLGLKAAVDLALSRDLAADMRRISELATYARESLRSLPDVSVQDIHADLSGIVTFAHATRSPVDIVAALKAKRINVASPQEPYAPLWFRAGRPPVTRISPHAFNTHGEIEAAVAEIAAL